MSRNVEIPSTIKDPAAWLKRREERVTSRRPRRVNYPDLKPGEFAIGLRKEHGKKLIKISRDPLPVSRNKYEKQT